MHCGSSPSQTIDFIFFIQVSVSFPDKKKPTLHLKLAAPYDLVKLPFARSPREHIAIEIRKNEDVSATAPLRITIKLIIFYSYGNFTGGDTFNKLWI